MHIILRAVIALTLLATVAVAPAAAESFTVYLTNGSSFETRYQPKISAGDPDKIVIITAVGNRIYLHKDDVQDISHQTEVRGFGTMINTTTVFMGWAPNDAPPPSEVSSRDQMLQYLRDQQRARPDYSVEQFVSAEDAGVSGGLPAWELVPGSLGGNQTNVILPPPAPAPLPEEGGGGEGQ